MAIMDILRQHHFPRSDTTSRDRKISGCHTKGYACLVGEKRRSTHKWISSKLSERFQKLVLDSQASDPVLVLSGVPQRSAVGPVLFLIFIYDLTENIRSSVRLFADVCCIAGCIGI